jgi:NADH-quinone oxidoreductase subunit J
LVGLVLLAELALVGGSWIFAGDAPQRLDAPTPAGVTNTHALGRVLYTDYIYLFQAAGLVLLVAMVGAIVLTLRQREGVRRQKIRDQLRPSRADSIEVRKVQPGSGI